MILFRIGSDADYDDVVRIGAQGAGRPVRLLTDSFRAVTFRVEAKTKGAGKKSAIPESITLLMASNDQEATGSDLMDVFTEGSSYHCQSCVLRLTQDPPKLSCVKPISEIRCESKSIVLTLKRVPS